MKKTKKKNIEITIDKLREELEQKSNNKRI